MIRIHCTKKLDTKLPLDSSARLKRKLPIPHAANDEPESPLSGWHANLLTIQRRNCVFFVHDSTRFPLLATCLTKPDFAELDWWFQDALMNTLLKSGANQAQMDAAESALAELVCDLECDRSVQATMNRMGRILSIRSGITGSQSAILHPTEPARGWRKGPARLRESKARSGRSGRCWRCWIPLIDSALLS